MKTDPAPQWVVAPTIASDQARLRSDKLRVADGDHDRGPIHQLHLVLILEGAGWPLTPPGNTRRLLPLVFLRIVHPILDCPSDIDDMVTDFFAAPAEVFEQLWQQRVELLICGVADPAFDRVGTLLVVGHLRRIDAHAEARGIQRLLLFGEPQPVAEIGEGLEFGRAQRAAHPLRYRLDMTACHMSEELEALRREGDVHASCIIPVVGLREQPSRGEAIDEPTHTRLGEQQMPVEVLHA